MIKFELKMHKVSSKKYFIQNRIEIVKLRKLLVIISCYQVVLVIANIPGLPEGCDLSHPNHLRIEC